MVFSQWKFPAVEPPSTRTASFVQNPGGRLCPCKTHYSPREQPFEVQRFCVTATLLSILRHPSGLQGTSRTSAFLRHRLLFFDLQPVPPEESRIRTSKDLL